MRRSVIGLLLALTLPASASAQECPSPDDGPRRTAHVDRTVVGSGPTVQLHTALVLCDAGRRRVLRRAVMTAQKGSPPLALRGREITTAQAASTYVAWSELEVPAAGARRAALTIGVRRLGRAGVRRVVVRRGLAARRTVLTTALSRLGDVAWWRSGVGGDPRGTWVAMRATAPRRIAMRPADYLSFLGPRTLWNGNTRPVDLRPIPVRDGCPVRDGFRRVGAANGYVVTRAVFPHVSMIYGELAQFVRICRRGSGRDHVLAGGWVLVGIRGTRIVFENSAQHFDCQGRSCSSVTPTIAVYDARRWRVVRRHTFRVWADEPPQRVLLDDGSIAWLALRPTGQVAADGELYARTLVLARPNGEETVLDSGPPTSLSDRASAAGPAQLRASGMTLTWTNDGQVRSQTVAAASDGRR